MSRGIKYSIIIANFNGELYLNDCLSSVLKTKYLKYEIIIVEDGSTDDSLQIIRKYQKKRKIILLQNKTNLGLVASRNKAIKKAKGDVLVFLDNDTEVDSYWLNGINEIFIKYKDVSAVQCKMFDFHKRKIIQQVGMKLIPYTGFGMTIGRGEKDKGQYDVPAEIISLGAALAVKKDAAKKIGGFDQKLFHYTDDLDFSWRLWIAGYKIRLAPRAKVYHYIKIHNPNYKLYFHLSKNSLRMIIKNYEFKNSAIYFFTSIIFSVIGGFSVLFRTMSFSGLSGVISGMLWNFLNLGDTLEQRVRVQKIRRFSDQMLFSKIMVSENLANLYKLYFRGSKVTVKLMESR